MHDLFLPPGAERSFGGDFLPGRRGRKFARPSAGGRGHLETWSQVLALRGGGVPQPGCASCSSLRVFVPEL